MDPTHLISNVFKERMLLGVALATLILIIAVYIAMQLAKLHEQRTKQLKPPSFRVFDAVDRRERYRMALNMGEEPIGVMVTGGVGYVGNQLATTLTKDNKFHVRSLDGQIPQRFIPTVTYYIGDLRNKRHIRESLNGVKVVFHMLHAKAKVGYDPKFMEGINVQGTRNLIEACQDAGVEQLIFTSSALVALDKNSNVADGIDETAATPRCPLDAFYRTQLEAEKLVLAANGSESDNTAGRMFTCVLRPALIYGLERKRLFTNFISGHDSLFPNGSSGYMDVVHIDSVIQAQFLALRHCHATGVAAGQVYHISNNRKVKASCNHALTVLTFLFAIGTVS
jgi:nucleoside-diphosphate-sugar epimerase